MKLLGLKWILVLGFDGCGGGWMGELNGWKRVMMRRKKMMVKKVCMMCWFWIIVLGGLEVCGWDGMEVKL